MHRRTPIFIVTSSRPRVGKTLIARALTEYFCAQRRLVAAFDVNPDEFRLIDHLPAYTAAASLNDTRGEMALFDQLSWRTRCRRWSTSTTSCSTVSSR